MYYLSFCHECNGCFLLQYGDAALHTAVRHDHLHLLPYLLGPSYLQSLILPTRNGAFEEVDHVNLQNEVSIINLPNELC